MDWSFGPDFHDKDEILQGVSLVGAKKSGQLLLALIPFIISSEYPG